MPCVMTFSPGREALGHDPVFALRTIGDDGALDRAVAGSDHPQRGIALRSRVTACCGTRIAEVSIAWANWAVTNMPGKKDRLRIGEAGAERDGAGALVDQHLAELDRAGVAVDPTRRRASAAPAPSSTPRRRAQRLAQREEVRGRFLDIDEHRVEPGDRGHRICLVGGDQRAFGDVRQADASTDRRRHARVVEVDLGGSQGGGFCATDASACRACATALV